MAPNVTFLKHLETGVYNRSKAEYAGPVMMDSKKKDGSRLRGDAATSLPSGKTGREAKESTMTTMTTMNTNVATATEIAKAISKAKDIFPADVRKVARKLLREATARREKMLDRWTEEMADILGLDASATLTDLAGAVDLAAKWDAEVDAEEASAKPKRKAPKKAAVKAAKKADEKRVEELVEEGVAQGDAEVLSHNEAIDAEKAAKVEAPAKPKRTVTPAPKPAPTAHVPARVASVADAIMQSEGKHLGDLCGWSLHGLHPKDAVEAAAVKWGLEDDIACFLPKKAPNSCYRRAIAQTFGTGKKDERKTMAYLVEETHDKLVHAIVMAKVIEDENGDDTVSARDAEFKTEIKVGFDKRAYRDGASLEGCLVAEDPDHPAAVALKAKYLEISEHYMSDEIRFAFQTAFDRKWNACPVLPHGGLWYVPAQYAEKVRAWHGFIGDLGMTTVIIPTFDTKETIESLRAATRETLEGQLGDLREKLEHYSTVGWDSVRDSTLERRMADFDDLRNRAELYESILGTTIEDIRTSLANCAARVQQDIEKRAVEAEEEAKRIEEEKAERKAAKKAEREEKKAAKAEASDKAEKAPETSSKKKQGRKSSKTAAA